MHTVISKPTDDYTKALRYVRRADKLNGKTSYGLLRLAIGLAVSEARTHERNARVARRAVARLKDKREEYLRDHAH